MRQRQPKKESKEKPAHLERRARVTFFLVAETRQEINAVEEVIHYFFNQYWVHFLGGEWELPITGFTHSVLPRYLPKTLGMGRKKDSIFLGHWWSETKEKIKVKVEEKTEMIEALSIKQLEENVISFVIDLPTVAEEWKFDEGIVRLKEEIFSAYERNERPQEEIWIVKQDIYRYA